MIRHTIEELSYLIDNRPAGTEYVAALDGGGDYTEYCSTAVRNHRGDTLDDYQKRQAQHKAYIIQSCEALYEVTTEGMKLLWEKQ